MKKHNRHNFPLLSSPSRFAAEVTQQNITLESTTYQKHCFHHIFFLETFPIVFAGNGSFCLFRISPHGRPAALHDVVLGVHEVLVLYDAHVPGDLPELCDDALLDEVDAHGDHGQAHQHVEAHQDEHGVPRAVGARTLELLAKLSFFSLFFKVREH